MTLAYVATTEDLTAEQLVLTGFTTVCMTATATRLWLYKGTKQGNG